MVAILALLATLFIFLFQTQKNRRQLSYTIDGPSPAKNVSSSAIEFLVGGNVVNDPYITVVTLVNAGAKAIKQDEHDGPLEVDLPGGQVILASAQGPRGALRVEHPSGAMTRCAVVLPLLNPGDQVRLAVITEGRPRKVGLVAHYSDPSKPLREMTPRENPRYLLIDGMWVIGGLVAGLLWVQSFSAIRSEGRALFAEIERYPDGVVPQEIFVLDSFIYGTVFGFGSSFALIFIISGFHSFLRLLLALWRKFRN